MTTTATLTGAIEIGTLKVPVSTAIPPTTAGHLLFTYDLPADQPPETAVGLNDFFTWANTNLKFPVPTSLPASLTSLSIGVSHLLIDTGGVFEIGVLVGSKPAGGTWTSSWKPVDALPFTFSDLKIEVDYTSGKQLSLTDSALASATILKFAATTDLKQGMIVRGLRVPEGATIASLTANSVTLSVPITGPLPVGEPIDFL